jgi:magnesium transporter
MAMPHVVLRWLDAQGVLQIGDLSGLAAATREGVPWVWVDVTGPDKDTLNGLCTHFGLHELAIEDSAHQQHRAKLDVYRSGLFMVWLTPEHTRGDGVTATELDVFIGKNYLITLHSGANKAVEAVAHDPGSAMAEGPAWVLHKIIDLLVDSTLPLVDRIGEQLSSIEDQMLDNPRQDDLRALHRVRRQLVRLHRILGPERDLLRGLARESDLIDEDAYRYFQDVGDHLSRALDSVETYQDVGASVMDVFLSAQNNRMNEIMKQLTVVATIFMPLTLISGIYGMNVLLGMWPPVNQVWSFWAVIGLMLAIAGAMSLYFRKKNWW